MIWSPCLNKIISFIFWIFFSSVQGQLTCDKVNILVPLLSCLSCILLAYFFIIIGSESKDLIPDNTLVVICLMIFKCPEHILWPSLGFHLWLTFIAAVTFMFVNLAMIVELIAVLHCGKHSVKTDVCVCALWAESACNRLASLWEVSNHVSSSTYSIISSQITF